MRIVSNAAFSVKEDSLHLEGFRIQHRQVGDIALLNLAERIAKAELNRLVPGGDADEILEFKPGNVAEVLETLVHPKRGACKIAALDKTRLTALELNLESAHLKRIAVLAVRAAQGVRYHLDVRKVAARQHETEHIVAEMDAVADDLCVEILNQEPCANHADLTVMERSHLVAEVRHVTQPLLVRRHELGELGAGVAAARNDSALEAGCGERRSARLLRGVRDHLDGRDLVDRQHFLHVRLAHKLRILGAAALGVDERTFKMNARHLRELRGLAVFGDGLRRRDKIVVADGEGRRKECGAAFSKLRLGDLLDRLCRGIAHVISAGAMEMHIDKSGDDISALRVKHPIVLAGLCGLRDLRYLSVHNLHCGAGHIHTRADDMGVYYDCFHYVYLLDTQDMKISVNYTTTGELTGRVRTTAFKKSKISQVVLVICRRTWYRLRQLQISSQLRPINRPTATTHHTSIKKCG